MGQNNDSASPGSELCLTFRPLQRTLLFVHTWPQAGAGFDQTGGQTHRGLWEELPVRAAAVPILLEQILRMLKGYDSYNTLLLPPRIPGEKLPPEVYEYFKEIKRSKEEQMKMKYLKTLAQENGENSAWGPSSCHCPDPDFFELSLLGNQLVIEHLPGARQVLGALCILFLTLTKWDSLYGCRDGDTFCSH